MDIDNTKLIEMIKDKRITKKSFARYFDHTLLKKDFTLRCKGIEQLCKEAAKPDQNVKSVCVYPKHIPYVCELLGESDVLPCAVIDFPNGNSYLHNKINEAIATVNAGAKELDYVINVENILKGDYNSAKAELTACIAILKLNKITAKFIIETGKLNPKQKEKTCRYIKEVGLQLRIPFENLYVKTSTGKYKEKGIVKGATIEDVMLLKKSVSPYKVKAAGGINDIKDALSMIYAGADRIGASKSYSIIRDFENFVKKQ